MTFSLEDISSGVAFGNLLAVIQHDDAVGDVHDRFHHMLDHDDSDPTLADFLHRFDHAANFRGIETGQHFIEQQQVGRDANAPGHFQALLLADVQTACHLIDTGMQTEEFQNFFCDLSCLPQALIFASKASPNHHIFTNGEFVQGWTIWWVRAIPMRAWW